MDIIRAWSTCATGKAGQCLGRNLGELELASVVGLPVGFGLPPPPGVCGELAGLPINTSKSGIEEGMQ
jgi:hypothetical protein